MKSKFGVRWAKVALAATAALGLAAVSIPASYAADGAEFYVVQGLPGKSVDVAVDGKSVVKNVKTAAVAGPFKIKAGSRKVTFSDGGDVLADRMFTVKAGSSWDVVVHLPASTSDDPVVTVFRNDLDQVPNGKASLVVAHTASVPPADIRVDGKVLFEQHRQRRVAAADRSGGDVRGGDRADRGEEAGHPRPGRADRQGRRRQPGLRGGRPRKEVHERRRACAARPGPAGPGSRPRSTPGPVAKRPGRARR